MLSFFDGATTFFCFILKQAPVAMKYKAIPLCLPNNLRWNPQTGKIQAREGQRQELYVVKEAIAELQKITGSPRCQGWHPFLKK